MACAANQVSYSCTDSACVSKKEQAQKDMEQAQQDIESYKILNQNIVDLQGDITACIGNLDCTYNSAVEGVSTGNASLFDGIKTYSSNLSSAYGDLDTTKAQIANAITELNVKIAGCKQTIAACGDCLTTCCK